MSANAPSREPRAAYGEPQRLHPYSLIVRALKTAPQVLVPLVFAAVSIGVEELFDKLPGAELFAAPVFLIAAIGIGLPLVFEYLAWTRFTWRLRADDILIEKGVLSRQRRTIPYERIQDVSLSQSLLHRIFGLATVKLETGAGEGEDGSLNALLLEDAEALRVTVQRIKQENAAEAIWGAATAAEDTAGGANVVDEPGRLIFAMDAKRLFIAGLFGFSLVAFAVLATVAQNVQWFTPDIFSWERLAAEAMGLPSDFGQVSWLMRVAGVFMGIVSLVALGITTGIIKSFVRDYNFRLDRTGRGFRRRRGLFTLTDMAMPLHRVQAALVQTGPLRRIFGWYSLKLLSLASENEKEADHLVAPLAHEGEITAIMAEARIAPRYNGRGFTGVESSYAWGDPALIMPLVMLGVAIAAFIIDLRFLLVIPASLLIVFGFQYLEWRMHGYLLDGGQLFVRHGIVNQNITALPIANVQSVDIAISPVGRLFGVVNVVVAVAGSGALKIHHIHREDAEALRAQLV